MKLICLNSPVKALATEGKIYPVIQKFTSSDMIKVSDNYGVPFYVHPVPGFGSLYQCKLGGKKFLFREYTPEHAAEDEKRKRDQVVELGIWLAAGLMFMLAMVIVS